jgi:hypothetical protein
MTSPLPAGGTAKAQRRDAFSRFLLLHSTIDQRRLPVQRSVRPFLNSGIALAAAGAVALAPITTSAAAWQSVALPHISTSQIHLTAVIAPADVDALVANLNAAMNSASAAATVLVYSAGDTLTSALDTAATLTGTMWDNLIAPQQPAQPSRRCSSPSKSHRLADLSSSP